MSVDNLYVEELNYGPSGFQPHNFVIQNGQKIQEKMYTVPDINYKNNFKWLNGSKYNKLFEEVEAQIEAKADASYTSGSNIVINTAEAKISFITINKYNFTEYQSDIEFIHLIPFRGQKKSQIINLSNFGMYINLFFKSYVIF